MADTEIKSQNPEEAEGQEENKEPTFEEVQRQQYMDPEGGYAVPAKGLLAEKKAMMS
tara:strand:- start:331 stop:501 length:171 start_codon:yes stop_codon:yes gene_type:complete